MADDNNTRSSSEPGDEPEATVTAADPDAPQQAPVADDSPEALTARLGEALQQAESFRDQALRAQAEAENTRRRASRDVENAHKYALEKFSADLLPVLDSLEKAVEVAGSTAGAESIGQGVELSLKLFLSVLEKHGIERIDPLGEPFDPQRHEALAMVPSQHAEPNSVLEVVQRGYLLSGRLVRAAKVVVAKAPDEAS
ncbi:MAG: nucleotide exchange factor GrpE [Pseudomonadales bacterium]